MHRHLLRAALAGAVVLASTLPFSTPAEAYSPDPTSSFAEVYTTSGGGCYRVEGTLTVSVRSTGCWLGDSVDGTIFRWDDGAFACKIEFRVNGALIAKFEFHPFDEQLWLYDTRNDGDTIYVVARTLWQGVWTMRGPFQPPGTSAVIDTDVIQLDTTGTGDVPEGALVYLRFYDDSQMNDPVGPELHCTA
jgi:hypothetical protein